MSNTHRTVAHRRGVRRAIAIALAAAVSLVLAVVAPAAPSASARAGHGNDHWTAPASDVLSPMDLAKYRAKKLKDPGPLGTEKHSFTAGDPTDPIDQRVLVIATNGDPNPDGIHTVPVASSWDWSLSTLTNALEYIGMPYDTYKSSTKQLCRNGSWALLWDVSATTSSCTSGGSNVVEWGALTSDRLWDGAVHAYYSAVMLADGALWYTDDGATYQAGLDTTEWPVLWAFEAAFGIRMVSAFTSPTPDYGMTYMSVGGEPLTATWTAEGREAFPYVTTSLPISNSYVYRAAVDPAQDGTTTPILTDGTGNVLGVVKTYPDQGDRQTLALTFNSARYFEHGQVLGFGLVNWVTKGQFLGFRKATLDPQIDDFFTADTMWWDAEGNSLPACTDSPVGPTMAVYRITGADFKATVDWQTARRSVAQTSALRLSLPFNGEGTVPGYWEGEDTLTSVARANQAQFKWINHSYDHPNLDAITYADAATTVRLNTQVAQKLKLTTYNKRNFVQPEVSGLTNLSFLAAAYDQGVRYLVSDTSRTGRPGLNGLNEGRFNDLDSRLFEVPRYPMNLYFNVTTPDQWLAEDNCLYPEGKIGHVGSYDQLLDREAANLVRYLLQGDNRPLMFHQVNLRVHEGSRSVFTDLMDVALTRYGQLVTVPISSPTMDASAEMMLARMAYNDALRNGGLDASVVPGTSMTLTSSKSVTVPLTGFDVRTKGLTKETYAGQTITYVPLTAGVPRTIQIR